MLQLLSSFDSFAIAIKFRPSNHLLYIASDIRFLCHSWDKVVSKTLLKRHKVEQEHSLNASITGFTEKIFRNFDTSINIFGLNIFV